MRKIIPLVLLALLWVMPSCDDSGEDDDKKTPTATLTVTVNYLGEFEGDYDTQGYGTVNSKAGEMINYVQLFSYEPTDLSAISSVEEMEADLYKEFEITENNTPTDLTGITPGDYYVIAFYDYRAGGDNAESIITQGDRYAIYDGSTGSPLKSAAQKLTITLEGPNTASFTIQRYWELNSSKYFLTTLTGSTIQFGIDYSSTGSGDVYVYVYGQLEPTSPRNNILYEGSMIGSTGTITITNVLEEYRSSFYACILYNYNTGGTNVINQGDYYEIYENVRNLDGSPVPITGSSVNAGISDTDGDGLYTLISGAAWAVTP